MGNRKRTQLTIHWIGCMKAEKLGQINHLINRTKNPNSSRNKNTHNERDGHQSQLMQERWGGSYREPY